MPDKLGIRCSGRPTTRPARVADEAKFSIEVGSLVDGWEGVVTGIGESGVGVVTVYVPGESLFLEIDITNIRISRDWVGDNWVNPETKPSILSLIPAKNNMLKSESSPFSSKETLELVDLEHVDPEPVDPESIDHKPVDPESIDHKPVDPESIDHKPVDLKHGDDFNENKPPQEGDPEFHEKEKDPGSALDDNNVQTIEQGLLSISSSLDGWAKYKGSHVFEQPQKVMVCRSNMHRPIVGIW